MEMIFISAVGQDSHRFVNEETSSSSERRLMLGGIEILGTPALEGNSDADVVLHALTNALSGLSAVPVLGRKADIMCESGITDSSTYVRVALETLDDIRLTHLSFSIEASGRFSQSTSLPCEKYRSTHRSSSKKRRYNSNVRRGTDSVRKRRRHRLHLHRVSLSTLRTMIVQLYFKKISAEYLTR